MIKIGYTGKSHVLDRLTQLQSRTSDELVAVLTLEGGKDLEKALHKKFSNLNCPGEGEGRTEWFRPGYDLIRYISEFPVFKAVPIRGPKVSKINTRYQIELIREPEPEFLQSVVKPCVKIEPPERKVMSKIEWEQFVNSCLEEGKIK